MTVQQDYPCTFFGRFRCNGLGNAALGRSKSARPFQPAVMIAVGHGRSRYSVRRPRRSRRRVRRRSCFALADLAETLREGRPRDNFVAFLLPLSMKMLRASRRTLPAETLPANMRRSYHIESKSLCPGQSPQAPKPQGAPVTGPQRGNAEPTILVLWKTGMPCS
jgi:hypothetical protein